MNRLFDTTATNQHFATQLKFAMRDAHVNGTQLSRLSGISRSMINKLRHGEHSPTLDMIVNINAGLERAGSHGILEVLRSTVPAAQAYPEPLPAKPRKPAAKKVAEPVNPAAHLEESEPVAEKVEKPKKISVLDKIKANLNK